MEDQELVQKIEEALEEIRPFLKEDGGDVTLRELTPDHTVRIELLGACKQCAMNQMTFKTGVEEAILRAVPQVKRVEEVSISA